MRIAQTLTGASIGAKSIRKTRNF